MAWETQLYGGGLNWNELDPCGDGGWTAIDFSSLNTVYASCTALDNTFLTKSVAGGAAGTFVPVQNGIDTADRMLFIPPMVMDPSNSKTLYFGTYRVLSNDRRRQQLDCCLTRLDGRSLRRSFDHRGRCQRFKHGLCRHQ